jgi:uncharacterized protein
MKNGLGAIALAVAVIASAAMFTYAFQTRTRATNQVAVVGSGMKDFEADLISWTGQFTRKGDELKATYNQLNEDREKVRAFLLKKGAAEKEIVFSAIQIDKEFAEVVQNTGERTQVFTGFRLTQRVQIESKDVDKYEQISRQISDLINVGIELTSNPPEYFYTKLAALKIEMVAAATQDAHDRAQKIVDHAGGRLGDLRRAVLGVFQITAQNSSEEFSWRGNYNTASRRKTATVTMRLEYTVK